MSKLDQLASRPATLIVSSRVDMRHLATIYTFWKKNGENPRSISELIRLSVEGFSEMLVTSHLVDFVSEHSSASEILTQVGIMTKGVQRTNLLEALAKEGKINSASLTTFKPLPKPSTRIVEDSPEFLQAQALLQSKMDGNIEDHIKNEQERSKSFLDALNEVPPIGE